ncbi:MAG: ABC transporter permease [Rhodoplanes sp.]
MNLIDSFQDAFQSIRANMLRSILTMLGVVIGVSAVILVVSIGAGAKELIIEQIESLGSNLIVVDGRNSLWLREADADTLRQPLPDGVTVSPTVWGTATNVVGHAIRRTRLIGVTETFTSARDWSLAAGRNFSEEDVETGARVVIIGATVASILFGNRDPVGAVIRSERVPVTVIGVLARKGESHTGRDQDDLVLTPIKTLRTRILGMQENNADRIDEILIKVNDDSMMRQVHKTVRETIQSIPYLAATFGDTINVKNMDEVLRTKESSAGALASLVALIAAVSLVVGGIGIMNIMLVSVIERTREIGIRVAVGARQRDILAQFLSEATALSFMGGAAGVVLGIVGGAIISHFARWPFIVSVGSIILALGVSVGIGVLFGYYPALRAARLNPIDALRSE